MNKLKLAVVGIGAILGLMIIAWLARWSIGYSSNTYPVPPSERNGIEKPLVWHDQRASNAYLDSNERAIAIEESFISAFPLRTQSRNALAAISGTQPGNTADAMTEIPRSPAVD